MKRYWGVILMGLVGLACTGPTEDVNGADPKGDAGTAPFGCDCAANERCINGACVVVESDGDGDGIPQALDCDDSHAGVLGPTAERICVPGEPCAPPDACAPCTLHCENSVWEETCEAPTGDECQCTMGATDAVPCGNCGIQERECGLDGTWQLTGECLEPMGACTPGTMSAPIGECGACGQLAQRCTSTCEWDALPVCTSEGECVTGTDDDEFDSCGACGQAKRRSRSCDTSCQWEPFTPWGMCEGVMGCNPGTDEPFVEEIQCERCGVRQRTVECDPETCLWTDPPFGTCEEQGVCEGDPDFGEVETQTETLTASCGPCNSGSQSRTRTCRTSCQWEDFPEWETIICEGASGCWPETLEFDERPCTECTSGAESGQRRCLGEADGPGQACAWGDWEWNEVDGCDLGAECAPGETEFEVDPYPAGPADSCSGRTRSRSRTCQLDCRWTDFGTWSGFAGGCEPGTSQATTRSCSCSAGSVPSIPDIHVLACSEDGARLCNSACNWGAWGFGGPCRCSDGNVCGAGVLERL